MSSDKLAELETKLDKALKRIQTLEDVSPVVPIMTCRPGLSLL